MLWGSRQNLTESGSRESANNGPFGTLSKQAKAWGGANGPSLGRRGL